MGTPDPKASINNQVNILLINWNYIIEMKRQKEYKHEKDGEDEY
jgi:hypothetical protein